MHIPADVQRFVHERVVIISYITQSAMRTLSVHLGVCSIKHFPCFAQFGRFRADSYPPPQNPGCTPGSSALRSPMMEVAPFSVTATVASSTALEAAANLSNSNTPGGLCHK